MSSKKWPSSEEAEEADAIATIPAMSPKKRPSPEEEDAIASEAVNQQTKSAQPGPSTSPPKPKKARSPPSSEAPAASPPTTPGHSHRHSGVASDFDRGDAKNPVGRQLWNPPDDSKSRNESKARSESKSHSARPKHSTSRRSKIGNRNSASVGLFPVPVVHPPDMTTIPGWKLHRQPDTKPISYEKLVSEVTGIYEGLIMVEFKCIQLTVDPKTRIPDDQELDSKQLQNLIGLHRTLLNEHHDFFLASSSPSATPSVRNLPKKYNMPGRMWRYGIQSFLELLRKRLPGSREHMLTFLAIAYGIMTLQHETIPEFADSWLECLGDVARYRMAIEENAFEREIWTSASRSWYSTGSERLPEVGRMYHHLGILAKPDPLWELYYYSKSLCVPVPFPGAWDSIMSVFIPILRKPIHPDPSYRPTDPYDELFVRVNAILLSGLQRDELQETVARFLGTLDRSIALRSKGWLQSGHCFAISLICSLVGYGAPSNPLQQSLPQPVAGDANGSLGDKKDIDGDMAKDKFETTRTFVMQTCNIVLRRKSDPNCLPFSHTVLVFLYYVAQHPKAMSLIEDEFPWTRVADLLNEAYPALMSAPRMADKNFPRPPANEPLRPLPEDYGMRGFALSRDYFPKDWFSSEQIEDEEKMFEPPSLGDERRQRVLWLGRRICELGNWLKWNEKTCRFTVDSAHDRDIGLPVEA
ncbi:hypothetical protein ISF_08168 [Cordyceps fumosorosea ARSEF 2679]|uniref:DNA/RNA-binding domain-containing protein n=1 Tax=Cordyceps fumosorosea (strain ARSEF 2679) TaxID=1081104 RepID=A0A167MY94_CORFA|nr:hypothetical protein ISF_08168 [Cordyceps fumosorosea ARSEF 2679]OAA54897.1 hypothetical protein ISF_08168 [Cordyceps fumosorosea ARSEF 2679]